MAPVRPLLEKVRFHSLALFPVFEKDRVVGTLLLRSARRRRSFSRRELAFLEAVAQSSRPAILNAHRFEAVEQRILEAPTESRVLEDGAVRFREASLENGEIMDRVVRLQSEVRRLKELQRRIREERQKGAAGCQENL